MMDIPPPIALLGGLLAMALSAYYMMARSKTGIVSKVAAAVNLLCILNASLGVDIVIFLIYVLVRPFSSMAVRQMNSNFAQAIWTNAMSAVLPPSKMVITGDLPDDETQAIVIANHQVDSDFWFIWELMRRVGREGALKIVLKDDQKHVPITGWGMRAFGFIFLKRDWSKDRENLERQLRVFTGDHFPLRLLIFPEGTTINLRSMEKCVGFAKKEQRPIFEHLLLPRTTGFAACMDAFVKASNAQGATEGHAGRERARRTGLRRLGVLGGDSDDEAYSNRIVYDMTIAYTGYSGEIPTWDMAFTRNKDVDIPNLSTLLRGRAPGPVHIHIEKHLVKDVASGDVKSWLDATWARKDALLKKYIADGRFPHEPVAVFESRKSPMAFLLLSAMPVIAGWLLHRGLVDLMASIAARENESAGGGSGGPDEVVN